MIDFNYEKNFINKNTLKEGINKLEEIFTRFDNETKGTILRSKGILKSEEGDNWLYFDYVPGQFEIREGNKDYIGKVCVIAAGYTEEELKEFFI